MAKTVYANQICVGTDVVSTFEINISWDDEAHVWVAVSDSIPLALESGSFDALIERVKIAAPEIIELNYGHTNPINLLFKSERLVVNG